MSSLTQWLIVLAACAVLVAACGGGENSESSSASFDVELREFVIVTPLSSVNAGEVTFQAVNNGVQPHDLVVVRSDLPAGDLPVGSDATVDVSQVEVVAASDAINPGDEQDLTATLDAGNYVLICNIPTHYRSGMYTPLTVQESQS